MKNLDFQYYNEEEFVEFLDSCSDVVSAKIIVLIEKIEEYGLQTALELAWVKKIEKDLYEIRVNSSGMFPRVLFAKKKGNPTEYIIISYFNKKSNKIPINELQKARKRKKQV
jgi:toxin-antitoxin system, toxin component, relE family